MMQTATSQDIKTHDGITYNTFAETARAKNLMIDDNEWDNCLAEGMTIKFPKQLPYIASICLHMSIWIACKRCSVMGEVQRTHDF